MHHPIVLKKWYMPKLKKFYSTRFIYHRVWRQKLSSRVLGKFHTKTMPNAELVQGNLLQTR